MTQLNNEVVAQNNADVVVAPTNATPGNASTKDMGLVKVGGAAIRFKSASAVTKDAGRVQIGGAAIRFKSAPASTKDAGRVQVGGAAIRF